MGIRFGLLRLSSIKKCPNMLRLDHGEPRNSEVNVGGLVVVVEGMLLNTETNHSSAMVVVLLPITLWNKDPT